MDPLLSSLTYQVSDRESRQDREGGSLYKKKKKHPKPHMVKDEETPACTEHSIHRDCFYFHSPSSSDYGRESGEKEEKEQMSSEPIGLLSLIP